MANFLKKEALIREYHRLVNSLDAKAYRVGTFRGEIGSDEYYSLQREAQQSKSALSRFVENLIDENLKE